MEIKAAKSQKDFKKIFSLLLYSILLLVYDNL